MATISTIKQAVMICRKADVTPWIWGHRGIGKSSLVQQLCTEEGMGFIDLRCSQLEAADIRGLPSRGEDNRTHFLPPSDMPIGDMPATAIRAEVGDYPMLEKFSSEMEFLEARRVYSNKLTRLQPHFQKGILFLDELNRAQDDVLQSVFQLVLDRKVGEYALPPGWSVVSAGNYQEGYQVNGFNDPAFLNRFCHLILSTGEQTLEEWVNYMSVMHGSEATDVVEFVSQNMKHLDGDVKGELGFAIQPSRRSWEMVTRVNKVTSDGKFDEIAKTEVLSGLVGRELGLSFSRYSCPVKPRDLLDRGVKAMYDKLKGLDRNMQQGLMWGLVSFCKTRIDEDKIAEVCLDYAEFMCKHAHDKDLVIAFCRSMVSQGGNSDSQEKARSAIISNPQLAQMISSFNKKRGGKKNFLDRLTERQALHAILSRVSWGEDTN